MKKHGNPPLLPSQHVLVVEDIVDTGRSITRLMDALKGKRTGFAMVMKLVVGDWQATPLTTAQVNGLSVL